MKLLFALTLLCQIYCPPFYDFDAEPDFTVNGIDLVASTIVWTKGQDKITHSVAGDYFTASGVIEEPEGTYGQFTVEGDSVLFRQGFDGDSNTQVKMFIHPVHPNLLEEEVNFEPVLWAFDTNFDIHSAMRKIPLDKKRPPNRRYEADDDRLYWHFSRTEFYAMNIGIWHGDGPRVREARLTPYRAGDTNLDGRVDFTDFITVSKHWGFPINPLWKTGDFNGDNFVDFADFVLMSKNWTTSQAVSVPEPSAWILCVGGLLWLRGRLR